MQKLIAAGAVESVSGHLGFSAKFCGHLASCNARHYLKAGEVKGWCIILSYFSSELRSLSEAEISGTVALLNYFMTNANRTYLISLDAES